MYDNIKYHVHLLRAYILPPCVLILGLTDTGTIRHVPVHLIAPPASKLREHMTNVRRKYGIFSDFATTACLPYMPTSMAKRSKERSISCKLSLLLLLRVTQTDEAGAYSKIGTR